MRPSEYWKQELEAWAIPDEIMAAAPESPWHLPTSIFAQRADDVPPQPTPSTERALEVLRQGETVLDVGCGAGAASLRLVPRVGHLIGVDQSADMLTAFRERAERVGVPITTIEGTWPDIAEQTPLADIVVCHHVVYNVQVLVPFIEGLAKHARRRVVLELTERHPLVSENDLWLHFHGLTRPTSPTADDALAVLREIGINPLIVRWQAPARDWTGPTAWDDLVAWQRRRLCLTADRDPEILEALRPVITEENGALHRAPRQLATIWWDTDTTS